MKAYRKIAAILLCAVLLNTLTGCSFADVKEAWKTVLSKGESTAMTDQEVEEKKANKVIRLVDESMAAPEFTTNLGDSFTYQVGASPDALTVAATAAEGDVTYQWYSSTADINGGGKLIEGATEATYTPDTSEKGTFYYYCVATATSDNRIRETASRTATITVEDAADVSVISGEKVK